ncbi:MAG: hypothetical protein OXL39_15795 [Caldilineaceae bacterium]|nr:hypothetical protein [Caldilineaceae bacterium]
MNSMVAVDEPVQVAVRTLPSGKIVPKSFVWHGRTHHVSEHGRRWREEIGGKQVRCFLVRTPGLSAFELRWDTLSDEWKLHRAWLMNAV